MTNIDQIAEQTIQKWLQGPYDEETKSIINAMIEEGKSEELKESFYKNLEFGTGGLRGIMGVGSNRMNKYTVGMATQGLVNYLKKVYPDEQIKFVIAHDNRNNSDYFARIVADVCSANGLIVFAFDELRPTPELSYAIRHLGCHSGVMLTASHNPKEYNGYKAYWSDGGQVTAPHDANIISEVNKITSPDQVKFDGHKENIHAIGEEIDEAYLTDILQLSLEADAVAKQHDLTIVFSPIHGTGITLVPKALERWGFTNVNVVPEQAIIDGNFPTVIYPNPEEEEAMKMALQLGREKQADVIMATDPDADRVGVAIRNHKGAYQLINGNQICSLLVHYVISRSKERNRLPEHPMVIKTIVTTELIKKIADANGIECFDTLTGFKHIGEVMTRELGRKQFLAGGEESYGYLVGDLVRDKDAVISCAFIAEMSAFYKNQGKSLFDALLDVYITYGYYKEQLISLTKKGITGAEEIVAMMAGLRSNPPATLGGSKVVQIKDYQKSEGRDLVSGDSFKIDLPKSNVLQFITEDGTVISARPSGTEPKIKFYCSVKASLPDRESFDAISSELDKKLDGAMKDLLG